MVIFEGRTDGDDTIESGAALKVIEFHEKPDEKTAAEWLARGNCYWNSGMFLCKASVYLDAIARFEPGILQSCRQAYDKRYDDLGFIQMDVDSFSQCRDISIDHAVIERADNVMLVPAHGLGWSDLGSWDALSAVFAEENNNRVKGDVMIKDATDNIVYSHDRLVSVLGVNHCIVIDTPDAVLVADRKHSQNIKNLVADMRANKRTEADDPHKVFRPWGSYETLNKAENFHVKRIIVNPGQSLSLQMHHHRSEHWVVVKGSAQVTRGEQVFTLSENESTYIPVQTKHRLENVCDQPVCLIEVQCGDYLEEDDIIRFDDKYGRTGQT